MRIIHYDDMSRPEAAAFADRIDPWRWIGRRPIVLVGRLAFYWTLCDKGEAHRIRVWRQRVVMTPRVRMIAPEG